MQTLHITRPDDWHIHLRDGDALTSTVDDASRYFGRAIVMPNLTPPVRNLAEASAYEQRIRAAIPAGRDFTPLMVLYLADMTRPEDIAEAKASGLVYAAKLYPAGATTNSDAGVTDLDGLWPVLAEMEKQGLPLLLHGEVTDADIDIFDREAVFIERHLKRLVHSFPGLRIVLEHITTADAADYVMSADENLGATITTHHLVINRNHILAGGIKPHYYCLPVALSLIHI